MVSGLREVPRGETTVAPVSAVDGDAGASYPDCLLCGLASGHGIVSADTAG